MIPHSKPTINREEIKSIDTVLRSGYLAQGPLTRKFESTFRRFVGLRYAVAANSGTSALHLALLALKIKPADEVIIPSYVCTAVLNAVNYVGGVPKVVDIDSEDFNISVISVKKKLSRRTKGVIVPHMFGMAADIDGLKQFGIPIIEDCAQSPGALYKGKKVGSFGLSSIFSFYATKALTTAEGGMCLTNNRDIYRSMEDVRGYDNKDSYRIRYNYKMSDLAAAMGLSQLDRISEFISSRQRIARMYDDGLADLDIRLPSPLGKRTHTYFRYVIRTKSYPSAIIIRRLQRFGIEAKRPIFKPLHVYLGLKAKDYPATEEVYGTAVSLPIYPSLKNSQVRFIIDKVRKVVNPVRSRASNGVKG